MSIGSFFKKVSGYNELKRGFDRITGKTAQRDAWARDDNAIQRQVADARAAGIHPLFALGGATGGGNTQTYPESGSQIGGGLKYLLERKDRKERGLKSSLVDQALINQANANARNADARTANENWQLQNSINKRLEGEANVVQDIGTMEPEPVRKNPKESKFLGPLRPRLTILEDGSIIRMNPLTSTGQELEDTHGEVMGNVYGIYNEAVRAHRGGSNVLRRKIIRAQKLNRRMPQYGDQRQ